MATERLRLSSIPFLKSSIRFHSGISHIPYRNFSFILFHFHSILYHALVSVVKRNLKGRCYGDSVNVVCIMHPEINKVIMGSALERVHADIFDGSYESKLFQTISKLRCIISLFRFHFCIVFNNEHQCYSFLQRLNLLALLFTLLSKINLVGGFSVLGRVG